MHAIDCQYRFRFRTVVTLICVASLGANATAENGVSFRKQLELRVGGRHFANYVYADSVITRPYFCDVLSPRGVQVTRNHPPLPNDKDDHSTMHPGIWLSFGDISGNDYWRMRAATQHVRFVEQPSVVSKNHATFTVENAYFRPDGKSTVCTEKCRYDLYVIDEGYLLVATSEFSGDEEFYFGDQEEMGLGIRLATPISVDQEKGGRILDSEGRLNGKGVWGKQARWCDYSGAVDSSPVGIAIFPDPSNFRESWWHARDYGFVAANPFGKSAFERGEKSKIIVQPETTLRLRFGILVHDGFLSGSTASIQSGHDAFLKRIERSR